MSEGIFGLPQWVIFLAALASLLAAGEAGRRLAGRAADADSAEATRSAAATLQAAMLGLLALLLGFTFSMAATRYDARKQLVVDECNALGTCHLRARLVPGGNEITALLRRYTDSRLAFCQAADDAARAEANRRSEALHRELWTHAGPAFGPEGRLLAGGLFVQSLNEVIDLHAKRLASLENHVPDAILWALFAVAVLTIGVTGYGLGLSRARVLTLARVLAVLVALVLALIIDLDRPTRGLIRVSEKGLAAVRLGMED